MARRSFLFIGSNDFAADYLQQLGNSQGCESMRRAEPPVSPDAIDEKVDIVLFEAGTAVYRSAPALQEFMHTWRHFPLVALCHADQEHRGIAAVRMGAQGYITVDDCDAAEEKAVFAHALQRHRLLERLSDTDGTVLSILKSINDGVIVVDRKGHVLDINPAARSILGLSARQQPPDDWVETFGNIAVDGKNRLDYADLPLVNARSGRKFSNQLVLHRSIGQPDLILSINGQGLYDGKRQMAGGIVTFRDVTDLIRHTAELEKRAQYDELTLLANRSLFMQQLEKAVGRSQRHGRPLAVLFIDLDRFKSVNDTLGHDAGDELLRQVATRLTKNVRIGDMTGRWGGDEFVVCLEDFGEAQNAGAAAQKLVLLLAEKYLVKGGEIFVTPSIGIALHPEAGNSAEKLIKAADTAMYQAKKKGGGRFQYFSDALNHSLEQRDELEMGLRHALVRGEYVLHYQPRIEIGSGRLIGFEALLRWQHPRFGLLPPERFLPILESSGLIHSAGEWVVASACRQLARWQQQYELPDLVMAINLSSRQLVHDRLVDTVSRALAETLLDPGCIELEIGDGDIVNSRSAGLATLLGLRSLGVRLSLDHFGTRDISFSSLDTGVIDGFVIDQSLIRDVEENRSHQRIVRAAIAMARGLNIEVAAEGVETTSQLEFLKSCDCDLAQGFLISKPMQAEKVASVLRSMAGGQLPFGNGNT